MKTQEKLALLQKGKLSAVDNVKQCLEKIKKDKHNIVLEINECAIEQAKIVDKKIQNKKAGKLAGLTIGVKAAINVKGMHSNAASKTLKEYIAPYDADVIQRIKDEDGIIIAILNCDEFASGSSGENSAYGATQNPAAPGRIPGGSSSGSAAAIAAGLCDLTLGTDTGGSIRNPASHCGVIGVKPSYGRVSRYGLIDLCMSLDQIGPMANDVFGAALLLEVIAGRSEHDTITFDEKVPSYTKVKEKKIKIGIVKEFKEMCNKEIYDRVMKKVDQYVAVHKAEVKEISLKHIKLAIQTYYPLVYVEFFSGTRKFDGRKYGTKIEETCGEEVLRRILGGEEISKAEHHGKYYRKALVVKELIQKEIIQAFSDVDVILAPTVPCLPHKLGEKISIQDMYAYDAFTIPANLAGNCGGVVPAGTINNIPVGIQVLAKAFDEQTLFLVMKQLEDLHD